MISKRYFYVVEKGLLAKINNMRDEEFESWGLLRNICNITDNDGMANIIVKVDEIGQKLYEFEINYDNEAAIKDLGVALFKDEVLIKKYKENDIYMVGKEAVLCGILYLKHKIIEYYEDLLSMRSENLWKKHYKDCTKETALERHIRNVYHNWKIPYYEESIALNLDENSMNITNSGLYEYNIFELVKIYKYTDWNKYGLMFIRL